jgi:hypothetical protein
MATKKKTKKKLKKSKKVAVKKTATRPVAKKTKTARKSAKKKPALKKKAAPKVRASRKKKTVVRGRAPQAAFAPPTSGVPAGEDTGDLQGLSNRERADSESVDELLDEGNAFEAGVVAGVEDADDNDEKEIRTREVPEDDVPSEYLDQD